MSIFIYIRTWGSLARAWRSFTRDETHVRHDARASEHVHTWTRAHSFTCSELSTASSTRAVADLLCLDTLVVEPSVASSQQSVARGSTLGRSGRVASTRLEALGMFQNHRGLLDCLPVRATWRIVNRRRICVSYCFGASDRLERSCRAATCVRSSAGSERPLSVVVLSPVPFSWVYFVIGRGLLFYRGSCMLFGHYCILCCRGFVL